MPATNNGQSLCKARYRAFGKDCADGGCHVINPPQMNVMLRDSDIRPALRQLVQELEADSPNSVVIEELGLNMGAVRVDVAVVNGIMHAYEIKSDFDSLRRLSRQAAHYGKCFDRVSLVFGPKHLELARKAVPSWWGLMRVMPGENGPIIRTVRKGRQNPGREARALIELLWREETLALLEHKGAAKGMRSKPREVLWDRAAEILALEEISDAVRAHLKANAGRIGLSVQL